MTTTRRSEKRHWDDFWIGAGRVEEIYDNEQRVSRHLAGACRFAGRRILEVGAGTGRDGVLMARGGATVVSLDYSMPSLGMVASQLEAGDRVLLCGGNALALPFPDGVFDLVFHQGLLEHFRDPGPLLAENLRVLRPGGLLLVDVPQRWHYYTLVKHAMIAANRWFAGWETEFSRRELERLLRDRGFEIVSSYGEWLNPPIWFRMLRRALLPIGLRLPMYPAVFTSLRRVFRPVRDAILRSRWGMDTAVVIGTIARKPEKGTQG